MSTRVTRKRARTESEDTSLTKHDPDEDYANAPASSEPQPHLDNENEDRENCENLERDAEFWISDGTIILVARGVEFRFYKALLADTSPVFKAVFAGQHPSRVVSIDKHQSITCPVVQLTDSPQDLRHILRAYLSGTQSSFLATTEPSFEEISAYIRLGRKYELKELYEHSRDFLKHHYTDDFKTWTQAKHWGPGHWSAHAAIGVINLARLIDEPSLLPTALLTCVYMKEGVMQGFELDDGTRESLSLDDIGRCLRASGEIRQATVTSVLRTFRDRVPVACKTQDSCKGALRTALYGLDKGNWLAASCPIRLTLDNLLDGQAKLGACTECLAMVKRRNRKEGLAMWARLPELLDVDVPEWPQDGAPQAQAAAS